MGFTRDLLARLNRQVKVAREVKVARYGDHLLATDSVLKKLSKLHQRKRKA